MRSCLIGIIAGLLAFTGPALADQPLATTTPSGPKPEILEALADLRRQYGADTVMIEGFLMGHAIENGSVLETAVGVAGIEERGQHKYLTFTLDTGIVYNDRELTAERRLGRTWTRIIERTLRRFHALDIPAEGVGFVITYAHKPYAHEADLRAHLRQDAGEAEVAALYLLNADITELLAGRISSQDLANRATVLVNGIAQGIRVEPPEPTPAVGLEGLKDTPQ